MVAIQPVADRPLKQPRAVPGRTLRFVACVLLGTTTAILSGWLAWLLAAELDVTREPTSRAQLHRRPLAESSIGVQSEAYFGATCVTIFPQRTFPTGVDAFEATFPLESIDPSDSIAEHRWSPPSWADLPTAEDDRTSITTWAFGWPSRCLTYSFDLWADRPTPHERMRARHLFDLSGMFNRPRFYGLPLRPAWGGFAINSACGTSAWAAVLFGLPALYRRARIALRSRRGLCPACAYDLRATPAGNPCPECGRLSKHTTPSAPR